MMISVYGLGWIDAKGYGAVRKGIRVSHSGDREKMVPERRDVFLTSFKNFGRLDPVSRMTCYAVGLSLKDAGLGYPFMQKEETGIIGTNQTGCLDADILYYTDYTDNGRTLGRGNLFIYTLPSSPLAEVAIHFGLQGGLFYLGGSENPLVQAVSMAAGMIENNEVSVMLVGEAGNDSAFYLVLSEKSSGMGEDLIALDPARSILTKNLGLAERVIEFEKLIRGKRMWEQNENKNYLSQVGKTPLSDRI